MGLRPTRRRSIQALAGLGAIGLALAILPWPSGSGTAPAQQPGGPACPGRGAVPATRVAALARGFNLTGWIDGPTIRRPDQFALTSLRKRGFTHVRLPVNPDMLIEDLAAPAQTAERFGELDRAIDSLLSLGYGVSLDLHPGARLGPLYAADPARGFELIRETWTKLAHRYVNRSNERLFFEVLNEPSVSTSIWNNHGPRLVEAIRKTAPARTIIYGPADFQQIGALLGLRSMPDRNIVYAVHYYAPMTFTHQGLDWSEDPLRYLHDVPFPARIGDPRLAQLKDSLAGAGRTAALRLLENAMREPLTEAGIRAEFAKAAAWAEQNDRPVILNEFGVLRWKAPAADRLHWLRTVREAAERGCIGWAHWDYADAFGMMRGYGVQEVPDEAVLHALLDPA